MEPLLLLAAGGLFALLFVLNALIQTIRRTERIGFWDTLLAFLTTLILLAALMAKGMGEAPLPLVERGAIIIAAILLCLSALIAIGELRRPQRLRQSRGVFGVGAALLVIASTFTVPFVKSYVDQSVSAGLATPTPVETEQQPSPGSDSPVIPTNTPARTATPVPPTTTNTSAPTSTATATATSLPTMTPTSPTSTPAPTLVDCQLVMSYNVNLRAAPDSAADVLLTIPFNTSVSAIGRSQDSAWWLVRYEGQNGWVRNDYVAAGETCSNLPVR